MNMTEILKAKGIADDVIQAILDDMKANKVYTASEENLDIRYGKLKTQHEGTAKQLEEANALIEDMKKSTKGQEDLQQKITAHEQREAQLLKQLEETQIAAEIKIGLLAEKALDVDYLTFKLKEKGELTLDENGKIKGWDDKVAALKTQLPNQFEAAKGQDGGFQVIEPFKLKGGEGDSGMSKSEFLKKPYAERAAFAKENPDAYKNMMNH